MSIQVVRPPAPTPYVVIPTRDAQLNPIGDLRLMPASDGRVSLLNGNWRVSVSCADLQAALDEIADIQQEDDDE